jgi:hypothetical protein
LIEPRLPGCAFRARTDSITFSRMIAVLRHGLVSLLVMLPAPTDRPGVQIDVLAATIPPR